MARTNIGPCNLAKDPEGAVAQLGERMNGIHEVRGSIPLGSTNRINHLGHPIWMLFVVLCAYGVPTRVRGNYC